MKQSPAANAGIRVGDRFLTIDNKPVEAVREVKPAVCVGGNTIKGAAVCSRRRSQFVEDKIRK